MSRAGGGRAVLDLDGPGRRSPHVTPLVAVWLDGAFYFTTGATERKAHNLGGNPHVILMTGCNSWDVGLDVVVEGDAVPLTDDDVLERLASAWATKWDGRWQYEGRKGGLHHTNGGMALVFEVKPTKILAFAKGIFSHTRHQFRLSAPCVQHGARASPILAWGVSAWESRKTVRMRAALAHQCTERSIKKAGKSHDIHDGDARWPQRPRKGRGRLSILNNAIHMKQNGGNWQ